MKMKLKTKQLLLLLPIALCALNSDAGNDGIMGTTDDTFKCVNGKLVRNACVSFKFSTGPMRNYVKAPSGMIGVTSDFPSPTHATPQALKVVTGMYGIQRVVDNDVDILKKNGSKVTFTFPAGSAEAIPTDENSTWEASLKKVDADGNLSVTNAVTYDLYTFNGLERVRFCADTNSANYLLMVDLRTEEGQVYQADEFGMSYIYDEEGVIRQVMAPTRLLDFVTIDPYEYEVRFYEPQDVSMGTNGLYEALSGAEPFEYWTVENPDTTNAYNRLNISRTVGGTERTFAFTYIDALKMWSSTEDEGETLQQTTLEWDASNVNGIRTSAWLADGEAPVAKWTKRMVNHSWGRAVMEKEDHISSTNSQITIYAYYTNSAETGRFKKPTSEQHGDGTWDVYDYDSLGRKTLKISSWKDVAMTTNAASAKAVYMDYTPHEASDVLLEYDKRPRTVTDKIEDIVTKKTFYTYKTNSVGAQVHIIEKCLSQSVSYGDAVNLRTIKTFYPPYDGTNSQDRLNSGRLKTVEHPDGRLTSYEYALGDLSLSYTNPAAASFTASNNGLDWQVSVIHGTTNSPAGIAGKTTKEVPIIDEYNNIVLQQTYVYTGNGYERIKWTAKQFDVYGHALETWQSDGTQESGYWGTGCCGKDNGTDRQGIETAYTYDLNKRMLSSAKMTTNDTAGVTQTYIYDAKGRRLSTVRSAIGIAALTNSATFDMLGRKLQQNAENGTSAQWSYNDANHTVTETVPGGATRVTAKQADGKTKSITGTAVVHETYDYGVNSDGTQWVKKYIGSSGTSSPMWEKTTKDLLGRTIKTEKPAFGGGVLTTKNTYDSKGNLCASASICGSTTNTVRVMEYDELSERIRGGMDVDQDGSLTLASMDRIADSIQQYVKENGDWFNQRLQIIYPKDGSSIDLTNSISKTRLTGLGTSSALGVLIAETVSADRFGNETVQKRFVDRDEKVAISTVDIPASTQDVVQVSINGLLQSATSAQSVETLYSYDTLERRTGITDPRAGIATVHYNDKNQIDYTEDAATNQTIYAYDFGTALQSAIINALGETTLYSYNDRGQATVIDGSAQYPLRMNYDGHGLMTDLYTLRGATNGWDRTQWLYDPSTGLVTNKLYADGNGPSYTYTPSGKLATRTWARGITTTYSYDSAGSLTNTVYSDNTPSISVAYNRLGQKTQVIDASGTNTFTYNSLLQLTNEVNVGQASSLSRLHDSFGRASGITHNSDYAVSYAFDNLGRFTSVSSAVPGVASGAVVVNYSYLPDSSFISGYTNNHGLAVSYDFEPNRNAKTQVLNEFGTNLVSSFDYTYDELMRRTQRVDEFGGTGSTPSMTNDFGYNARSELTSALMGTNGFDYAYDNIGNRNQTTENGGQTTDYLSSELNQYLSVTSVNSVVTFQYDSDGNLTNDAVNAYAWNGENRLIKVTPINPTTNNHQLIFSYDYMGRRTSKDVYEWDSSQSQWSNAKSLSFVYDGWNLISGICSPTSGSSSTNCFIWGLDLSQSLQGAGGVGGLLAVVEGRESSPSEPYFPAFDANGNVTDYVSTNGTAVAHYEYNPYGGLVSSSGSMADDFAFRFSTKYLDTETGLSYYGFRYYNPESGRWLNRDPIEERGGINLYHFVYNNPLNYVDTLGLDVCDDLVDSLVDTANKALDSPLGIGEKQIAGAALMGAALSERGNDGSGDTSGIRSDLTDNGQGSQAIRHIWGQAGGEVADGIGGIGADSQAQSNVDQTSDPNPDRAAQGETEVRDDEAGRQAGQDLEDYMDGNLTEDELRDKLKKNLCDCP